MNKLAAAALLAAASLLPARCQELKFANLGDFKLESGATIRDCRLGYRTFGTLNIEKSNAILFPTWFGGTTEDLAGLIGPGKLVDSSRYFVITVDALGNGVSSSPSNSKLQPGRDFPKFSIRDMVNSEHLLATKELKLSHLHAVIGISMGGMQTFQWIVSYPEFMGKAVPIIGSPRLTSYDQLLWNAELKAIESAQQCSGRAADDAGLPVVVAIHQLALETPSYRARETSPGSFAAYLDAEERAQKKHYHANDWASQLRAMLAMNVAEPFHDSLEAAAATAKAKVLVVAALQDHMVNPAPAFEFARYLNAPSMELTSDCGHLASGCEAPQMNLAVAAFLAE